MDGTIPKFSHVFRQDQALTGDSSDLSAVRAALGISGQMTIEKMCVMLDERLHRSSQRSVHSADGDQHGRFRELARLIRAVIFLVYVTETTAQQKLVNLHSYGEADSTADACIYILYDQASGRYQPLGLSPRDNPDQYETKLDRKNNDALGILGEFVRDELGDPTFAERYSHVSLATDDESPRVSEISNIGDMLPKYIPDMNKGQPFASALANLTSASEGSTVVVKYPEVKEFGQAKDIDQLLRCGFGDLDHIILPRLLAADRSERIAFSSSTATLVSAQVPMRLETEVITSFRGRTRSEYKPKKALKRSGAPSKVRHASYFANRNNEHVLHLLIWHEVLLGLMFPAKLEVCILTKKVNGCFYIHPYFKFQTHPTNRNTSDENPIFIPLDAQNGFTESDQFICKLKMYLVVIMLTNRQLMENQPIQPFESPASDGQWNIRTFKKHKDFKPFYELNELCFAFTLWKKYAGDDEYHRLAQIQHISNVSRQDPKWKKPQ